ncbi:MAG: tetratricopeptide repeat protein [Bacteroidales bacterium]
MAKQGFFKGISCFFLLLFATAGQGQDEQARQRKFDYFYYEGLKLKQAGKYDAAFDAFNHCLSIDSTAAPVLYELSGFYLQLGYTAKAIDLLKRAVARSPGNFTYKMGLATVYRSQEMFGEAVELYEDLVRRFPKKTELNYYLAEVLTQAGETGKAIDAYNALELSMGMNEGISMQKYRLYKMLNKSGEAFNEIEKLAAKFPMEARYRIILGDIYLEDGKPDKAYEAYQEAYAIDPESPYYIVSMANYYEATNNKAAAETQVRNALVNDKLDVEAKVNILSRYLLRLQQSNRELEHADTLFVTLLERHPEETELRLMYGRFLAAEKKYGEAKFQFQLVTETEPENSIAWQQWLELSLKAQDMPEVIRLCQRCIELFPDAPEYYFYLGIGYYQQNDYPKALEAYRTGVGFVPDANRDMKSTFYGQVGDLYHQWGQPDSAYAAYETALEWNDRNIVALNNYAYFLSLSNKDLKKAERMSAQCIKLEPNNATYLDTYAWIFFKQGNYTLALFYIKSALEKDTTNSTELIDHYGDILFMSGNREEALVQWKKAREMGKTGEALDRKIAEQTYIEDKDAR